MTASVYVMRSVSAAAPGSGMKGYVRAIASVR